MKKLLLTITAFIFFASFSFATEVVALTIEGKRFNGNLQEVSDSSITIYNRNTLKKYTIMFADLEEMTDAMGGRYNVVNGKLDYQTYEDRYFQRQELEKERMGNPNYTIGKALKSSGSIGLAIGVPCFVLGSILVIAGQSGSKSIIDNPTSATVKAAKSYSDCTVAGCVLMPLGGALTIIGIPLYVHGKSIMELAVQLSDNGPGVAVKF